MNSTRNPGRVAGVLYLMLVVLAPYRLMYIPSALFVRGDAAATAANIAAHETLFRLGMVADALCGVILIFLTLALYRLFKSVDADLAVLVVLAGGIIPATIDFVNILNDAAALTLVRGPDYLAVFDKPQRDALARLFLELHHQVIVGAEIMWGLWLFPLGLLTYRSRFLPSFLGVWLIVNGVAYIVISLIGRLLPKYESVAFDSALPALLGEVAFTLWLVIRGARPFRAENAAPATAS